VGTILDYVDVPKEPEMVQHARPATLPDIHLLWPKRLRNRINALFARYAGSRMSRKHQRPHFGYGNLRRKRGKCWMRRSERRTPYHGSNRSSSRNRDESASMSTAEQPYCAIKSRVVDVSRPSHAPNSTHQLLRAGAGALVVLSPALLAASPWAGTFCGRPTIARGPFVESSRHHRLFSERMGRL
jgi:hypothetical protein